MSQLVTKKTFGGANIAHISPSPSRDVPRAMNVVLSFEDALKLHLSLGQLLAKLNSYNRSSRAGRRTAANLCVYPHKLRVTVNEGRLRKGEQTGGSDAVGGGPEADESEDGQ